MASADYLKKYYSNDDSKSKKKKKLNKAANFGGMKVVEDDAFIMVKPKSRGMPSDEEEIDETEEEIREKQRLAEKLKFRADTFQPVEDIPNADSSIKNGNSRRKERHDSDTSPPRRKRHDSDRDASPPRRNKRHDSDREETPPRRRQRHDSDTSPPRRQRHDCDRDVSPPRRRSHIVESPPRRRGKQDSDTSPPRRKRHDSDRDASPPRRKRHDSDESPPRRSTKRERDSSPPRRNYRSSPDRKDRKSPLLIRKRSPPSPTQFNNDDRVSKTLDGKKAGLVSAKEMRKELGEHRKREVNAMEGLDDDLTGRFAETKIRTKLTGKNRKGTKEDEEKKAREEKKNEELKEKYEKWNRGITQLKQREAQLKEEERVMKEGFSRYADDEAMNEHLKDELLADDPMAALISKKREKVEIRKGLVYPSYKGHWPPNRYNIAPGYRWDGVNRSNGFEAQLSLAANKRKADEEAAYRAITECAE